MTRTHGAPRRRRIWSALAAVALLAGLLAVGASPANSGILPPDDLDSFNDYFTSHEVQANGSYQVVVGDFDCDYLPFEILWYAPGPARDYIWELYPGISAKDVSADVELPKEQLTWRSIPLDIDGYYDEILPIQYDLDDDCGNDVLMYGRGAKPDTILDFEEDRNGEFFAQAPDGGDGISYTPVGVTINGDYENVVPVWYELPDVAPEEIAADPNGGDHYPGVLFHAPGSAADYEWLFGPRGEILSSRAPQIRGHYKVNPATTSVGYPGILFDAPGGGPDYFWSDLVWGGTRPGTDTMTDLGGYFPDSFPIGPTVFDYAPGTAPDEAVLSVDTDTGGLDSLPGRVNGTYRAAGSLAPYPGFSTLEAGADEVPEFGGPQVAVYHRPGPASDYVWISKYFFGDS